MTRRGTLLLCVLKQIVEENKTAHATRYEPEVVLEPVYTPHTVGVVPDEHHLRLAVVRQELVNADVLLLLNAGEHVASVGELDLAALLDRQRFVNLQFVGKHIAHVNLGCHCDSYVQSRGVEGHSKALFVEDVLNLELLGVVVPNRNSFVAGARHDQLLAHADIEPCHSVFVELTLHVPECDRGFQTFGRCALKCAGQHLASAGNDVGLILVTIEAEGRDVCASEVVRQLVVDMDGAPFTVLPQRGGVIDTHRFENEKALLYRHQKPD